MKKNSMHFMGDLAAAVAKEKRTENILWKFLGTLIVVLAGLLLLSWDMSIAAQVSHTVVDNRWR